MLLVSWIPVTQTFVPEPLDVIEFFSGSGRVSKWAHFLGFNVRCYDIDYDHPVKGAESSFSSHQKRSCFDINGEAGILFLIQFGAMICNALGCFCNDILNIEQTFHLFHYVTSIWLFWLRLAVLLLLQGRKNALAIVAVVCSTWSLVNRHTSQRDELVPEGQVGATSVRKGNRMVSRVSLLLLLIGCLGQSYVLENPERSIILEYPRLKWVIKALRRAGVRVVRMILVDVCFCFEHHLHFRSFLSSICFTTFGYKSLRHTA